MLKFKVILSDSSNKLLKKNNSSKTMSVNFIIPYRLLIKMEYFSRLAVPEDSND